MRRSEAIELLTGDERGIAEWNRRRATGEAIPKLEGVDFALRNAKRRNMRGANLREAYLRSSRLVNVDLAGADLTDAKVLDADLYGANLDDARMAGANLIDSDLCNASLRHAILTKAALQGCNLNGTNLTRADLRGANLEQASLVGTHLRDAKLDGCFVYGVSAWDVELDGASQQGLRIRLFSSPPEHPDAGFEVLTVDDLEVSQFIYVLLYNKKVRRVIDTITSKLVLLLGAFSDSRKPLLDALRTKLRKRDYCPVMFDFEKPANRDLTETIQTLAHLARFVVVDLTDPRSVPHELASIVPHLRSVPVVPLIAKGQREYGMFKDFGSYPWVLKISEYHESSDVLIEIDKCIICPAERKVAELKANNRLQRTALTRRR